MNFVFVCAVIGGSWGSSQTSGTPNSVTAIEDTSTQSSYANAHSYVEQPSQQLVKLIPELKHLQPAPDQQALPEILHKTGLRVNDFFSNIVDLVAHEKITQAKLGRGAAVTASQDTHDNYLLVLRSDEGRRRLDEYRMDSKGSHLEQVGLDEGYIITSGFAMSCTYFSTVMQAHTAFRYLGDERIDKHNTYVVAFAQRPYETHSAGDTEDVRVQHGKTVHILVQGIAWVDKNDFQIVRLRADLLAPRPEIGLDRQTTDVTFSEVRLRDIAAPLWLPSAVKVYTRVHGHNFENEHHYTDYQRYRASAKVVIPQ
jgi:hypothetical protein